MSLGTRQLVLTNLETALEDVLTVTTLRKTLSIISDELMRYELVRYEDDTVVGFSESQDYIEAFLNAKALEGKSKKTLNHYRYVLTKMLKHINLNIKEITIHELRNYMHHISEYGLSETKPKKLADKTLEGYRNVYGSFFGWLHKEKLIPDNPCLNLGKIKCVKKLRKPFSEVEIAKIRENCKTPRDLALVHFLLSTGCRISEVCSLNINNVDFEHLECTVLGKGNKERTVFLDDVTAMFVKRYIQNRKYNSSALFVGKGNKRLQPGGVRLRLNQIGEMAGGVYVHPHRFRRTLATNLIDRGMAIQEVATILGHDDINTTLAYVYIDKHNVKTAYQKYA